MSAKFRDMEFSQLAELRQSERKYSEEKVNREDILKCIEAARLAPSACNSQPWKFVVVEDDVVRGEVAKALMEFGLNKFAPQAPVIVVVVREEMNRLAKIGSALKDKDYSMFDIGMTIENFCLQATELGLGTCIVGSFNEGKVAKLLGVPEEKRIPLVITLGHPAGEHRAKIRKSLEEITTWNKY